jgi:tetratricopeptide (TPR) repeat protein
MLNYGKASSRGLSSGALLSAAPLALAALLALGAAASTAGCAKVGELKAKKAFKEANQAYQQQDYKKAAQLYEDAIQAAPDTQTGHESQFFLANSYDNQYKPSKKGDPENDALLTKAVQHYEIAAQTLAQSPDPNDKLYGKRALEFLVLCYGADKLNDPAKAEPVVQKMIQLEPEEPTNYFALAKIYEDAGAYPEAEQTLLKARDVKPSDPAVYMTLAGYYNRQNEFDKTIDALEQRAAKEPTNPEAFFTIATYYWDNAQRNFRLTEAEKKDNVAKGLTAVNKAIELKPDYMEALVYKGLLLRLQANMEKDPKKQQELIKEAVALHDKAEELRKKRTAGISD